MISYPLLKRFRLYREHKYIITMMSKVLTLTAKTDFAAKSARTKLQKHINNLKLLLESHAEYEEDRIHLRLKQKGSKVFEQAELDHHQHTAFFAEIMEKLHRIDKISDGELANAKGHEIYLDLRKFTADNIVHLNYEEQVLLPELQQLYTDEEIKAIDHISYQQMYPEQIAHMLAVLFPCMNQDDKRTFLSDIKKYVPEKFNQAWPEIVRKLTPRDRQSLEAFLNIQTESFVSDNQNVKLRYPWEKSKTKNAMNMKEYHKVKNTGRN